MYEVLLNPIYLLNPTNICTGNQSFFFHFFSSVFSYVHEWTMYTIYKVGGQLERLVRCGRTAVWPPWPSGGHLLQMIPASSS